MSHGHENKSMQRPGAGSTAKGHVLIEARPDAHGNVTGQSVQVWVVDDKGVKRKLPGVMQVLWKVSSRKGHTQAVITFKDATISVKEPLSEEAEEQFRGLSAAELLANHFGEEDDVGAPTTGRLNAFAGHPKGRPPLCKLSSSCILNDNHVGPCRQT